MTILCAPSARPSSIFSPWCDDAACCRTPLQVDCLVSRPMMPFLEDKREDTKSPLLTCPPSGASYISPSDSYSSDSGCTLDQVVKMGNMRLNRWNQPAMCMYPFFVSLSLIVFVMLNRGWPNLWACETKPDTEENLTQGPSTAAAMRGDIEALSRCKENGVSFDEPTRKRSDCLPYA